jgi:hypothetical protein
VAGDQREGRAGGPLGFATFIVRIAHDDSRRITGVVEWVRTGEKIRVHDLAAIGEAIGRIVAQKESSPDGLPRHRSSARRDQFMALAGQRHP